MNLSVRMRVTYNLVRNFIFVNRSIKILKLSLSNSHFAKVLVIKAQILYFMLGVLLLLYARILLKNFAGPGHSIPT